jgi:hypothetical protein
MLAVINEICGYIESQGPFFGTALWVVGVNYTN